jgi:pimeloyl-ACP methyl ester carboxylesterase
LRACAPRPGRRLTRSDDDVVIDVVLLHSGVTDPGEWNAVRPALELEHRVVAPALWQARPLVELALEAIPEERAALVGTSLGGRAALEAASAAPERVEALVLIGTNPFGWSDAVRAIGKEEGELYDAGRLDDAASLMVSAWLVGDRRQEEDVPRELRERVFTMQRRGYELGEPDTGTVDLARVRAPLLYLRGELDWPDLAAAGDQLVRELPDARVVVIDGCAHLPTMERPDEVARLILEFLGR